ncbi:MAG: mersacidin/lichenicidin family type 2 lantibiotic [Rhizonema sp. PD37]|nr:mersacidin/lichenicidin family type 2 lantibiotic [Rhizonema sp. PD37]
MAEIEFNDLDIDIVRAWKDEEYRNSLSDTKLAQLPQNPAGLIELTDFDMRSIMGGLQQAQARMANTGTGSGAGCSCWCT